MAERRQGNRIVRMIRHLSGNIDIEPKKDPLVNQISSSVYDKTERNSYFPTIIKTDREISKFTDTDIQRYITTVMTSVSKTRDDNEKIFEMMPDVSKAASIVISSIISPNELKNSDLIFNINKDKLSINNASIEKVITIISDYFNIKLNLKYKLKDWLMQAMYKDGSKITIILPLGKLDKMYNNNDYLRTSMEDFEKILDQELKVNNLSIGITDLFKKKDDTEYPEDLVNDLYLSVESFSEGLVGDDQEKFSKVHKKLTSKATISPEYKEVIDSFINSLEVSDNIEMMKKKNLKKRHKEKTVRQKIREVYSFGDNHIASLDDNKDISSFTHPLWIDVASEACIPLYIPGNPKEHVGYFLIVDMEGYPVEKKDILRHSSNPRLNNMRSVNTSPFDKLFRAYGLQELNGLMGNSLHRNNMSQMYKNVIESYIKNRIEGQGFGVFSDNALNGVYHYMFSKFLEGNHVRLLYVPKDFVSYMAFDYNDNGTGKSRLENIKFFLSLQITLLISKIMGAINNSTDHKNIEVQFGQETNNAIGDPLAIIEQISSEYIKKNMVNFTLDPNHIMESIAKRSVHVKASGLPGLQDLNITTDRQPRQRSIPDPDLLEDIRNQTVMGLGPPPSALNALSEHEYSRSVASSSLIFSREIEEHQNTTVTSLLELIKMYIKFDPVLQKDLTDVLHDKEDGDDKPKDQGTETEENSNKVLFNILENLEIILPKPSLLPNQSTFEALRTYTEGVTSMVDNIFPDEISANDDDIGNSLPFIRSYIKKKMITTYMTMMGYEKDLNLPDIESMALSEDDINTLQMLKNISRSIAQVKQINNPTEE